MSQHHALGVSQETVNTQETKKDSGESASENFATVLSQVPDNFLIDYIVNLSNEKFKNIASKVQDMRFEKIMCESTRHLMFI